MLTKMVRRMLLSVYSFAFGVLVVFRYLMLPMPPSIH